tara:strand:+ start:267 stop:653 length:387 start_codon:yes stop_codon:yes gene_type:complete
VISVFRAGDFLDASAASSYQELLELGHIPGVESPHVLGYADPIEKATERPSDEDPKGVEVRNHPGVMLSEDPELWDVVDRFRCNVQKELTHDEFDRLSAWQIEAWVVMLCASNREEMRQIEKRGKNGS